MKTFTTVLVASLMASLASLAFAGPGAQYWQTSRTSAAPAVSRGNAACAHMLVPNTGPTASRMPLVSASCTPEMTKADPRCQSHCGLSAPHQNAAPTGVTCEHMLMRNTGVAGNRAPFISVKCTPEMLKNNPDCQSSCRLGS